MKKSNKDKNLTKFSVEFAIKAIVHVDVFAENAENAVEQAKLVDVFSKKVDVISNSVQVAGYSNRNLWDEMF